MRRKGSSAGGTARKSRLVLRKQVGFFKIGLSSDSFASSSHFIDAGYLRVRSETGSHHPDD